MIKKYLLIGGIFTLSFLMSNYLIDNVFLASSPKVNPFYLTNLGNSIKSTGSNLASVFSFKKANIFTPQTAEVPDSLFKSVSKGVSAYDKGNGEVVFKINNKETNVSVREIEINGKNVKVIDLTGE